MPFDQDMAFRDCPWCGLRDAQMTHHGQFQPSGTRSGTREFSTLSCPRCAGVTLLETYTNLGGIKAAFPETGAEAHVEALPPDVSHYYRDAITVLEAGVPGAAAVQLRKTLEAAAAHRGVEQGSLVRRIEELIQQGVITSEFGKVLDRIRKVGNVGAHANEESVTEDEARRALKFTTQVLRNLFEIPAELGIQHPGNAPESNAPPGGTD